MARLQRILVAGKDGLKTQRFSVDLTGADLFVGGNGVGKSTRLLAVLAGLRGLAQSPSDSVREYLGPTRPDAVVDLVFDGRTLRRDLQAVRGKAAATADALADDIAGPHLVRWDLGDFARDSDASRAKLLERICSLSGAVSWECPGVQAWLVEQLDFDLVSTTHVAAQLLRAVKLDGDVGAWVSRAIEWARAAYTEANAAQKQATQGRQAMEAERAQASAVGGTLDAARAEVTRAERDLVDLHAQERAARQAGTTAEQHEAEGRRLAAVVAATQDAIRKGEEDLVELRRGRGASIDHERPTAEAEPRREAADAARAAAADACEAAAQVLSTARGAHAAATATVTTLGALLEGAEGACRHCQGDDPLGLRARLEAARSTLEGATWALEDAVADKECAAGDERRAIFEFQRCSKGLLEARAAQADQTTASQAQSATLATLEREIVVRREQLERDEEALILWQEREAPDAGGGAVPQLGPQIEAAEVALAAAKTRLEQVSRQQEREAALQRQVGAALQAEERFAQVKALGAALKDLQARIAADAYGPIMEEGNTLLTAAGLDLRLELRSAGEYGATRGGQFIHFAALSDAERAELAAAICYAFGRLARAPWKAVILDRLEVIDEDHIGPLLRALAAAVADGRLDNFLGAFTTTSRGITAFEHITVHYLDRAATAAEAAK